MAQGDIVVNRFNLYLKSSQRTNGTNESPTFMLTRPLFLTNPFNIFEVTIKQAMIPFSFQSINTSVGNLPSGLAGTLQFNQLEFYVCRGGTYPSTTNIAGGGTLTNPAILNIPPGNYSITTLCTQVIYQLTNYMVYVCGLGSFTTNNFFFYYSRDTMTVNFQCKTTDGIVTTFYFLPSSLVDGGLAYNLGIGTAINFGSDGANNSLPVTYPNYYYEPAYGAFSSQNVNVAPITSILVRSDYLKQNRSIEFIAVSDDLSDILLRVPVQTIGTTFINYDNTSGVTNRLKNGFIDQVSLYLTDNRTYTTLNLNGLDWMVMIEVAEIESHETRQNSAHQMLKQIDFANGMPESIQES